MSSWTAFIDHATSSGALVTIAELLVRPGATAVFCAIVVGYGAWSWIKLRRTASPAARCLHDLQNATRQLEGKEGLALGFESYRDRVRANAFLRHAWDEFEESLIKPGESDAKVMHNSHEPAAFFNEDALFGDAAGTRQYEGVPNRLLGLGILGTFVGLASGVHLASASLTSPDPSEVQRALSQLLSGAALAFLTSIAGLGCSLGFGWSHGRTMRSLRSSLAGWVEEIEQRVELVTAEQIAIRQLREQSQQTVALQSFSTDLAVQLAAALDETIAAKLGPQLEGVIRAIEGLRTDRADTNTAAMQAMIEQFAKDLSGSAGRELEQMGQTLESLGSGLEGLVGALGDSQERTREAISGAARELRDSGAAAAAGITGSFDALSASLERLESLTDSHARLGDSLSQMCERVRSTTSALLDANRALVSSLSPAQQIAREFGSAGERVEAASGSISSAAAGIAAAARSLEASQSSAAATWAEYRDRFQGLDLALQGTFKELDEGISAYTSRVESFHTGMDKAMGSAVTTLTSAIGELHTLLDEMADRAASSKR